MKKLIALFVVLTMAISMSACTGTASTSSTASTADSSIKPVTLTIYSPGNDNSVPTKTIVEYAKLVKEASNGAITLTVHSSGELGNDAEAIESTRMGTIDIIFAGTSGFTAFYDKAKLYDLPFLFKDAESAYNIVNSDIGEEVFSGIAKYNLVFLAEGDNGMRQISTTNRAVHTAADIKGLKLRVPTSQMYLDVWQALGANPVSLSLNELAPALSNGTVEGQDNATYHEVANATYDNIKYFSYINYMWMGCTMAVNSTSWGKLDPQVQTILKEQAVVAAKYSFDTIAADNITAAETMKAAGVTFDESPDIQSFKTMLDIPSYYTRYAQETWYDQATIDAILAK